MKEIIHIVGINNELKNDFISKILSINPNYNIVDVDELSSQITNEKKISKLFDDYEKNKNDKNKSKGIASEINNEWARELQSKLNKILNSTDKNSILIGLTTSIINVGSPKININFPTNYKFIIDIDVVENAKQHIRNNLKEYKHAIINGKFPLEYLNLDYLVKRREQLNNIYIKNLYIPKKIDDVLKFLKNHIQNLDNFKAKKLYYASSDEFSKTINKKNLTLYYDEVSAILSVFDFNNFLYDPHTKTIKELNKDSLKELEKDCYLYEITDLTDIFFDGDNFKNNKKIKINKMTYFDSVNIILQKFGIKFIKYKDLTKSTNNKTI